MSDWRKMYSAVEQTYRDAAQLLMDADGLLLARGLRVAPGRENVVGMEGGASLAKPSYWYLGWMSRHYGRPATEAEDARWYVAVLLCAREGDDVPPLDEPVITAGVLADRRWWYWVAKAWCWGGDRPVDGTVVTRSVKSGGLDTSIRCFARPISVVRSPDDLVKEIIEPLLKLEAP